MSEEDTSTELMDEIEAVVIEEDTGADADGGAVDIPDASGGELTTADGMAPDFSSNGVLTVPIEVVVSVGKAQPLIKDFLNMRRDSLLVLDSKIDDPVEVRVAGRAIARGELQEVPDQEGVLAVRLTEIVTYGDM